jgi:hypothetical protein
MCIGVSCCATGGLESSILWIPVESSFMPSVIFAKIVAQFSGTLPPEK